MLSKCASALAGGGKIGVETGRDVCNAGYVSVEGQCRPAQIISVVPENIAACRIECNLVTVHRTEVHHLREVAAAVLIEHERISGAAASDEIHAGAADHQACDLAAQHDCVVAF